jgi:chromate transporter
MAGILELIIAFFKLGLFAYGGGLAVLVLLQDVVSEMGWLTSSQFADVIAISQSTPGPVAINLASFVGYLQEGILGAVLASIAVALPGIILSLFLARFMNEFNEKPAVKNMLRGLRAAVIGLIGKAVYDIACVSVLDIQGFELSKKLSDLIDLKSFILFSILLFLVLKFKKHPIIYIIGAGVVGILIY